ncbi:MAG TPA: hypothetical protein VFL41_11255 [Gaiellaceae bacterium]|nr:hypothetical protein [Gaiellaceae bacterium]
MPADTARLYHAPRNPIGHPGRRSRSGKDRISGEGAGIATVGRRPGPAVAPRGPASATHARFAAVLDGTLILRVGLALLFFANALVAWVSPDEFRTLMEKAHVDRIADPDAMIWLIRLNDAAIAVALLVLWPRWPRLVSAWVGLYVLSVGVVKLLALA